MLMDYFAYTFVTGVGATALMDGWGITRKLLLGIPAPNYGLVGRWLAGFARGRFRHESIAASPPMKGERLIGWTAHYAIGIAFAAVLIAVWGRDWIAAPRVAPALIVGIASVAAPFLLMQPGMGAGIAASRTPRPSAARLQSLITHTVFGLGLYCAGLVASLFYKP
jgi:hypothetical protein